MSTPLTVFQCYRLRRNIYRDPSFTPFDCHQSSSLQRPTGGDRRRGNDPNIFRPERWLIDEDVKIKQMKRTCDLVFGYRPTKCLATGNAGMELNKATFVLSIPVRCVTFPGLAMAKHILASLLWLKINVHELFTQPASDTLLSRKRNN